MALHALSLVLLSSFSVSQAFLISYSVHPHSAPSSARHDSITRGQGLLTTTMLEPATVSLLGLSALSTLTRTAKQGGSSISTSRFQQKSRCRTTACNLDSGTDSAQTLVSVASHSSAISNGTLLHAIPSEALRVVLPYKDAVQKDVVNGTRLALRSSSNAIMEKRMLEEEYPVESMTIDDVTSNVMEKVLDTSDKVFTVLQTKVNLAPHKMSMIADLGTQLVKAAGPFVAYPAAAVLVGALLLRNACVKAAAECAVCLADPRKDSDECCCT